jgi:DNA-binding NarL/FixJ family response regulator
MKPKCVLLADDHAMLREGLTCLLAANRPFVAVGEARKGPLMDRPGARRRLSREATLIGNIVRSTIT